MDKLKKYIINEIRKVINEEMGISEEVTEATEYVIKIINKLLANPQNYTYFDWNGDGSSKVFGIEEDFPVFVFGKHCIYMYLRVVVCNSNQELKGLKDVEKYSFMPDASTRLTLHFPIVRKKFKKGDTVQIGLSGTRIRSTIAHELKHAYQYLSEMEAKGNIGEYGMVDMNNDEGLGNFKERVAYQTSHKIMKQKYTKQIRRIGYLMYYVDKAEITANVQKLYSQTLQDAEDLDEALYLIDTSHYVKHIYDIRNLIEQIETGFIGPRIMKYVEGQYNRPAEWIIKKLRKGEKELLKGLGRVKMLVQKHKWDNSRSALSIAQYDRLKKMLKL